MAQERVTYPLIREQANAARTRPTTRTINSLLIEEQEFESTTRSVLSNSDYSVSTDSDGLNNHVEPETKPRPIIKWNATCIRSLIYPLTIISYLLIGALVLMSVERENDKELIERATQQRKSVRDALRTYNLTEAQIEEIFENITDLCDNGGFYNSSRWDFVPSFMFVTTTITTIGKIIVLTFLLHKFLVGYGMTSPATRNGRVFVCFYALMGIPLFLVYMATVGRSLAGIWDALVSRIPRKSNALKKPTEVLSILVLVVLAFVCVVFFPALAFQYAESQWTYNEAIYFAIVSLTTIGYGDFIPAPSHLRQLNYVVLYVIWLFVGLAVVSLLVAKMADVYSKIEHFTTKKSKKYLTKCLQMKNKLQANHEDDRVELSVAYVPME